MTVGLVRYVSNGWIDVVFVEPTFFFKYWGFEWVSVPGPGVLYAMFGAAAAAGLAVTLGLAYRTALAVFVGLFTYVQLMDVTNYLNHYYLAILLSGLMLMMPLDRFLSLRTALWPGARRETVPVWMLYLLRFQVAVVYSNAALAKMGTDWLVHGQPMNIWMSARSELPVIGPWLAEPGVALAMSWAGFLYDLTIVGWLLWRRSRPVAYAVVLVFHGFTWLLFDIGMFPFIMTVATTLFFEPDWPRRLGARVRGVARETGLRPASPRRLHPAAAGLLALYCTVQVAAPLRHWLYGGDVLWHEQGMRYAWKVMVREKNGSIEYRVRDPESGREWRVSPRRYLDWRQANEMSGQPDLILQLAHRVRQDFEARGVRGAEVRVDAWVSLNGRQPRRLIDPDVDLTRLRDGVGHAEWILPGPTEPPSHLRWKSASLPR